jgi:cob(I)alamin adenosyltransferase
MMEQRLDIQYYLDEDEVRDIVITDLQEYILTLTNFLKTPDYEDAKIDAKKVKHLKEVLKAYMDRQEYKDFIKSL